jgi:ATP-dependent RNA helicase DDX31/DBP7
MDKEINHFSELAISDKLKQILQENGFDKLTNIQRNSIPAILQSKNIVLKSETGSGKTLAYLVPLIEYLSHYSLNKQKIHRLESGTMAIIFSPTRELAVQIDIELKRLLKLFYYMVSTTIMGGESAQREKARLRKGCVILICTPGRLLYHLQATSSLKLDNLQYMIFDEADRMLDLGFEREMN